MRNRLFSLSGVKPGEESMISMILIQSVLLGIFFGSFDISAHSLFLSVFDEKLMAKGYIVSGIAGIILTSLFAWFGTRKIIRDYTFFNILIVTTVTFSLWLIMILNPAKWVIFIVFILLGPLNILVIMSFRAIKARILSQQQEKRLLPLIDSGLIIGIIIISITIPILILLKFPVHYFFLVSALAVLGSAVLHKTVVSGFEAERSAISHISEPTGEGRSFITVFIKDQYIRIITIFLSLSVITVFFIQYSFMAVTRIQYTTAENLAMFLGFFTGGLMIITLILKRYLFSYLIKKYGLRACLTITPVFLAIITVVSIVTAMFEGYSTISSFIFITFFILLAFSRLISISFREAVESPSLKTLWQSVDADFQYGVKSLVDGRINEIAVLISGLILTGIGFLSFVKIIHFSWVLLMLILVLIYFSYRLFKEYGLSIRKSLDKIRLADTEHDDLNAQNVFNNRFAAERNFRKDYFSLISGDYSVLERNGNFHYYKKIIEHSGTKQDTNLLPVLKKMTGIKIDEEIRRKSAELLKIMEDPSVRGRRGHEKIHSANNILSSIRMPHTTEILRLLRDSSIDSKRLAICTIGKFSIADMLPEVCACLNIPGLEVDSVAILSSFGRNAEKDLMRFYLMTSGNPDTSITILRLFGRSCSRESMGFLFSRLWSNSRQLKEVALNCLIGCRFSPSQEDKNRLNQLISDIIGIMTWNLSAKMCLEKSNNQFLLNAIKKDDDRWERFLFDILSITYGSASISKIRESLERETVESINYALGMLELLLDDSIRLKIISLLDIVPDDEKLKNLNLFYPTEIPQYTKLIDDIINRDYNLISIWTKACVLRDMNAIDGDEISESVVALLFSPEGILQEEAAKLIARSDSDLYRLVSQRIPEEVKKHIDLILNGILDEKGLLFEKTLFLSDIFSGIPGEELLSLAEDMLYLKNKVDDISSLNEGVILWSLSPERVVMETHILYSDESSVTLEKVMNNSNNSFYILLLNDVEKYLLRFPERSAEILQYFDNIE